MGYEIPSDHHSSGRVPTTEDHLQDKIDGLRKKLESIRELASDLYAQRGEDTLTARRCNQIMEKCNRG